MNVAQVVLILLCVFGISLGQLFFKLAADSFAQMGFMQMLYRFPTNPYLVVGLVAYAFSTALWIWVLRLVPLSSAYPFMAVAFILVPLMGWIVFGEQLSTGYFAGLALVVAGLLVVWMSGGK